jgi:2-keto-4-pentenoate hydratase/2-oxohepta-3-ene-1,7-dioic acid hydratase in catechol pathway
MVTLPVKHRDRTYLLSPSKIIALGLNYRDHIKESVSVKVKGFDDSVPPEPILFPKTPNVLIGPEEDIILPSIIYEYGYENPRTDYEAELALIIGTRCRSVARADAMDVIFGYTAMNDVSQRNIQNGDRSGWFRGKSFDTFGPAGPCILLNEDVNDPHNLSITCRLNGKTVQQSNTKHMIFSIPEIIEFITKNFTLEKGDIIMTGTPSGVGPLQDGDRVEVEIEEIGILKNNVRTEKR